jgi:hypothetical protein
MQSQMRSEPEASGRSRFQLAVGSGRIGRCYFVAINAADSPVVCALSSDHPEFADLAEIVKDWSGGRAGISDQDALLLEAHSPCGTRCDVFHPLRAQRNRLIVRHQSAITRLHPT